jgi:FtsP/CotA-like multicopper oxidase with cupredoxin domain
MSETRTKNRLLLEIHMNFQRQSCLNSAAFSMPSAHVGRLNRRNFLTSSGKCLAGALSGLALTDTIVGDAHSHPGNPLRIPPLWSGEEDLVVTQDKLGIWPGFTTNVYAINGSVPGPLIRMRRGDVFRTRVVNLLPNEPLVIHWHGLLAPEAMDGHPAFQIESGKSYHVEFPILQRGATCWYHSHTDRLTAEQVYQGLAGFYIIDDPDHDSLGLPSGDHDIPLVISDWRSNTQRQLTYAPDMMDRMIGYLGDTILVNGTPDAWHAVDQGLYRFRLLNGSNARIYNLAFNDNRKFLLIGNDGGLLPAPVEVDNAVLAPGQRLEILIDFSNIPLGESLTLRSLGVARDAGPPWSSQSTTFNIITFYIESPGNSAGIAENWPQIEAPPTLENLPKRQFILSSSMMSHFINGRRFELDRVDYEAKQGEWEVWEFINQGPVYHPMHVHAAHFSVMERQGNLMPPEDSGWRDTVLVAPGETVRVLIRFDAYPGMFLAHCHNLEHEDAGMMLNFKVISDPEIDLKISYEGNECEISWPETVSGQLEASTDLSQMTWENVPVSPELEDGRKVVRIQVSGSRRFFRLSKILSIP